MGGVVEGLVVGERVGMSLGDAVNTAVGSLVVSSIAGSDVDVAVMHHFVVVLSGRLVVIEWIGWLGQRDWQQR